MNSAGAISLDRVMKHFAAPSGEVRAVDDVTLDIEPGSSVAISGVSGCGKSTLLSLIAGLEAPTSGRVAIGGQAISSMPERERARFRRRRLGLVFQADNLHPFLSALENVSLQLALSGAVDGYERCTELLAGLGLGDEMLKLPDHLSGGQRQRVAVARALVHAPSVILADEPTGSLDAENSVAIVELLLAAQHHMGTTLVVVTHDPQVAARMDRTVVLRSGRLSGDAERPRAGGRAGA